MARLVGGMIFEVMTILCGLGWGWTGAFGVPGLAHPLLAPANALAAVLGGPIGAANGFNVATRAIASVLSVILGIWLVVRTRRDVAPENVLLATAWALLGLAWLGPALYPWYLTWGVALAGVTRVGAGNRLLIGSILATSFVIGPGGYGMLDVFSDWRKIVVAAVVVAVMVWVVRQIARTTRTTSAPAAT